MAHLDVELHHVASQVNIAVLQTHFLVRKNCLARKKRRLFRFIQDAQFFHNQLDFAGRDVLIDGIGIALLDIADDGDNIFIAQRRSLFMRRRIQFAVHHHLGHTGTVTQVNKNDAAEIASAVDPSHEHGFFPRVRWTESATHLSAFQVA